MNDWMEKPVLLTGATGFMGSTLYPRLVEMGLDVRCATRRPEKARREHPGRKWVEMDVENASTVRSALEGCGSVFYLVHQMKSGEGYGEREKRSAETFLAAAEETGVRRIVYLGGVEPNEKPSEHLASRLQTGRILRSGTVSTIELRAAMIVSAQSESWQIVRDLAARLPIMILPHWTKSRSEPVHVDDVIVALCGALQLSVEESHAFDIPGPEILSVEEILNKTAQILGYSVPKYPVPLLSPRLSSYWLRFVTRCDLFMARELVDGLKSDLLAKDDSFWERIDHTELISFEEAARDALEGTAPQSLLARGYEKLVGAVSRSGDEKSESA